MGHIIFNSTVYRNLILHLLVIGKTLKVIFHIYEQCSYSDRYKAKYILKIADSITCIL